MVKINGEGSNEHRFDTMILVSIKPFFVDTKAKIPFPPVFKRSE